MRTAYFIIACLLSLFIIGTGCDISKQDGDCSLSVFVEKEAALTAVTKAVAYVQYQDGEKTSKDISFDGNIGAVNFTGMSPGEVNAWIEIDGVGTGFVIVQLLSSRNVAVRFNVYSLDGVLCIDGIADYPASLIAANYINDFDAAYYTAHNADDTSNNDQGETSESMFLDAQGGFFDASTYIFTGPELYMRLSGAGSRSFSFYNNEYRAVFLAQNQNAGGRYGIAVGDSNDLYVDDSDTVYLSADGTPSLFISSFSGFTQVPDAENSIIATDQASTGFNLGITVTDADYASLDYAFVAVSRQFGYLTVELPPDPTSAVQTWNVGSGLLLGSYSVFAIAADTDLAWLATETPVLDTADPYSILDAILSRSGDTDLVLMHYFMLEIQP